ncbi:SH3 domain-containing protein [Actinokineospora pegani]|uniref:SH3 domain-containing protein n=1 Tax=Actinokineospora pegani TaxID=2654637 RepID=UPI001F1B5B16|nr:SH3 domain-containing protein [Actinokineospora pegani]
MLVPKKALLIGGGAVVVAVLYTSNQPAPGSSAQTEATCRVEVTADVLNVRSAPEGGAEIVGKFNQGAETDADKDVRNGYRKLGADRWASAEFLKPLTGHDCG